MRAYCLIYIASPRAVNHTEPEVHMKTVHGRFEDRMEDGIHYFAQRNYDRAFGSFDQGFSLIREMFMDDHPMSLVLLDSASALRPLSPHFTSPMGLRAAHQSEALRRARQEPKLG